jgi:hypothetical protein
MKRQDVLTRRDPLTLWAVIDEAALCRLVGGADTMAAQLTSLAVSSTEPHINVQVIPFGVGAHPGMPGSFVVMEFADSADPALIYCDSMSGDLFLEKAADVRRYTTIFSHMQALALSPADSTAMIRNAAKRLKG